MKIVAWQIDRCNNDKFEVVPSPLTDETFLDEGDEAHALIKLEDHEAALKAEAEECAKVAMDCPCHWDGEQIAKAIRRARGAK